MTSVSVVVPCYRCAATIGRAVRSALEQSAPPDEVILVDDASGDGTLEALTAQRREHGERVRIIELQANRGPASARNMGWAQARGDNLAFLDADDAWHPRKLELQSRFMAQHPEFALTGHLHWTVDTGIAPEADPPEAPVFTEIGLRSLLYGRRFATTTVMLRRGLPQRFPEGERYAEDYLLWCLIAAAGGRLAQIEARLATRFEPLFGGGGLSGHLWPMAKAEQGVIRRMHREGAIGAVTLGATAAWSLAKYARRVALVGMRRAAKN